MIKPHRGNNLRLLHRDDALDPVAQHSPRQLAEARQQAIRNRVRCGQGNDLAGRLGSGRVVGAFWFGGKDAEAGLMPLAASVTPASRPPPPTGAMMASRPGTWSSSSRAAVPWPAITSGWL